MKKSTVTPIFKQGDREDVANYRPISILSFLNFLKKTAGNIIMFLKWISYNTSQYGFRSGHSTAIAILNMQDKISEALNNNEYRFISGSVECFRCCKPQHTLTKTGRLWHKVPPFTMV